jgi:hypothetical protein
LKSGKLLCTVDGSDGSTSIEHAPYPSTSCDIPKNNPIYDGCKPTFTIPMDPIAPEELLFPDPCSFTEPLNFLGVDRQTILNTYYGYLETNKATDIDQFFIAVLDILVDGPETSSSSEVLFELDTPVTPLNLL